jgi:hypothetical protein
MGTQSRCLHGDKQKAICGTQYEGNIFAITSGADIGSSQDTLRSYSSIPPPPSNNNPYVDPSLYGLSMTSKGIDRMHCTYNLDIMDDTGEEFPLANIGEEVSMQEDDMKPQQ